MNTHDLVEAEARMARMAATDRKHGFAPPEDCSPKIHAATIIAALAASMAMRERGDSAGADETVLDALVMARALAKRLS